MSAGTAGAVFDAIARMRRAERELARPRIGHVRALPKRDGGTPDRLPFPCFFLCEACGRLEEGSSGDPMRRDGEGDDAPGPCPACDARAWIDLRRQSTALAYREAEEMDSSLRDEQGWRRSLWIGGIGGTIAITTLALLGTTFMGLEGAMLRAMVMLGLPVAWLATSLGVRVLTRRARAIRSGPLRWRHALPRPHEPLHRPLRGTARGEASLCAPLSQRPCLGFVVQVWSDGVQLLDEQRHVALTIDAEGFEADSLRLELAADELERPADDEALGRFLQRRGLSRLDPSLRVREALLVPGAAVEVRTHAPAEGERVPSAHLRAA